MALQHRLCTGLFNNVRIVSSNKQSVVCNFMSVLSRLVYHDFIAFLLLICYIYILLYITFITLDLGKGGESNVAGYKFTGRSGHFYPSPVNYINLAALQLLILTFLKSSGNLNLASRKTISSWKRYTYCTLRGVCSLLFFVYSLNLILLVICNMSIINPGPINDRPLSVYYNNVQGLVNTRDLASKNPPLNMTKVHELHGYLYNKKPDVVILNETWLKGSISDNEILPNGYKIFRLDRSAKTHPFDAAQPKKFRQNGGGVLIAHRVDLDISSSKIGVATAQAELLSITLKLSTGRKLCISTFYRVGTLGNANLQEFKNYFRTLASKNKIGRHILIGDMNLNQVSWPSGSTSCDLQREYVDFLTGDLGHTQLIDVPTHKAGNVLDLFFTNIPDVCQNVKVLDQNEACLSDHFGITFQVRFGVHCKRMPKRRGFDYSRANWDDLNFDLRRINWDQVVGSYDPHTAWPRFKTVLDGLCKAHIPIKSTKCQFQPPWFDSDCDKILRDKEKWRKKARISGSESDLAKFRKLRKDFKSIMNEKMRLNVEDPSDRSLISKKFWSHVKSKSKSTRIPETVRYGDRVRNSPAEQASLFNEYFSAQFSQASNYDIDIDMGSNSSFMDLTFHQLDVMLFLKEINPGKAAGPDGIHGEVLKNCATSLCRPLAMMFNTSFATGCIPEEWKLASVVPVHKKGDKGCVGNYRPISLTSLVMKIFERCIRKELFAACEEFLDPRQHGFVNDKSCTTQMVPFVDSLALTLNNRSRSDVVYFDFAKAFDSVSHDLILHKLKNSFRIDGLMLRFIKSYLQDRQQQVVIGGSVSDKLPVQSGVPQGSILGPLLFVLFINDMFECISEGTQIALYADDTKIWREISCYEDHITLQGDIDRLLSWSIQNRMTFHPSKCKVLSVTMQRNVLDNLPFNIYLYNLNNVVIDYVDSHVDLGLTVSGRLLWNLQCDKLVTKASSKLGLLMRTCHFTTNTRQKRALYLAIVRSIFEHCSVIWFPYTQTHLSKFDAVQKRAVKWLKGQPYDRYSDDMFLASQKELNILPMRLKFYQNALILFYRIINGLTNIPLPNYITVAEAVNFRYTRSNAPVIEGEDTSTYCCSIAPNCESFRNSYFVRTVKLWNALPASVRQISRVSVFKTKMTLFLWSTDTDWPD